MYRSLTAPYFAPPSAGTKLGNVPTATHSYTDPTAVLTVAGNTYYYVVAPMNASDAPIGASNRTGAFVFGLVPGNDVGVGAFSGDRHDRRCAGSNDGRFPCGRATEAAATDPDPEHESANTTA